MEAPYTHRIQGHLITVSNWNLKDLKAAIPVMDQREAIEVGDVVCTFPIIHEETREIGHTTMWYRTVGIARARNIVDHVVGRVAKSYGEDESYWGDLIIRKKGEGIVPMMVMDAYMRQEGCPDEIRVNTMEEHF